MLPERQLRAVGHIINADIIVVNEQVSSKARSKPCKEMVIRGKYHPQRLNKCIERRSNPFFGPRASSATFIPLHPLQEVSVQMNSQQQFVQHYGVAIAGLAVALLPF